MVSNQIAAMVSNQITAMVSNQIATITVLLYANHLVPEEVGEIDILIFESTCLKNYFFSCRNKALFLQSQLTVLSQPLLSTSHLLAVLYKEQHCLNSLTKSLTRLICVQLFFQ